MPVVIRRTDDGNHRRGSEATRYMMFVKMREDVGEAPEALQAAVGGARDFGGSTKWR